MNICLSDLGIEVYNDRLMREQGITHILYYALFCHTYPRLQSIASYTYALVNMKENI